MRALNWNLKLINIFWLVWTHFTTCTCQSQFVFGQSAEYGTFLTFSVRTISNFPYIYMYFTANKRQITGFLGEQSTRSCSLVTLHLFMLKVTAFGHFTLICFMNGKMNFSAFQWSQQSVPVCIWCIKFHWLFKNAEKIHQDFTHF